MGLGPQMTDISVNNQMANFNTGPYGDCRLKIKISKIELRHVLSWPKVDLEPKFHDPGTFGGFGKREHTHKHTRFMFYKYIFEEKNELSIKYQTFL